MTRENDQNNWKNKYRHKAEYILLKGKQKMQNSWNTEARLTKMQMETDGVVTLASEMTRNKNNKVTFT